MTSPPANGNTPPLSLHRRITYSLLRPVVSAARRARLPLKDVVELARLAYYEEIRRDNDVTQDEIAELLSVSKRTVATLASQHRSDFLAPEDEIEAARRIEARLEDGPHDAEALGRALPDLESERIERLLAILEAEGRVSHGAQGYAIERSFVSLLREDLQSRVDGLNHILDVVGAAVRSRLVGRDPRPTVARTLSFAGSAQAMEQLSNELVRTLRHRCADAEEAALSHGDTEPYAVTLVLAPMGDEARNHS